MAKLTLNNIGSRYGSIDALNDNFDAIETAFENTLSRDGTGPNNMESDLDMDSNDIINVGSLSVGNLRINGQPVSPGNINYTGMVKETIVATAGQTVFDLTSVSYAPLTNNLSVYVDGVYQNPNRYTETSSTRVTLSQGVHVGAVVDFVVLSLTAIPGTVDAANVTYTPAGSGTPTTVATKLQQYVSVKDFGAAGDGVTDDTIAIQAAINYGMASGKAIYVPDGKYLITSSLSVPYVAFTGVSFKIFGTHSGSSYSNFYQRSVLLFTGTGACFDISIENYNSDAYVFQSLSIVAPDTSPLTRSAVKFTQKTLNYLHKVQFIDVVCSHMTAVATFTVDGGNTYYGPVLFDRVQTWNVTNPVVIVSCQLNVLNFSHCFFHGGDYVIDAHLGYVYTAMRDTLVEAYKAVVYLGPFISSVLLDNVSSENTGEAPTDYGIIRCDDIGNGSLNLKVLNTQFASNISTIPFVLPRNTTLCANVPITVSSPGVYVETPEFVTLVPQKNGSPSLAFTAVRGNTDYVGAKCFESLAGAVNFSNIGKSPASNLIPEGLRPLYVGVSTPLEPIYNTKESYTAPSNGYVYISWIANAENSYGMSFPPGNSVVINGTSLSPEVGFKFSTTGTFNITLVAPISNGQALTTVHLNHYDTNWVTPALVWFNAQSLALNQASLGFPKITRKKYTIANGASKTVSDIGNGDPSVLKVTYTFSNGGAGVYQFMATSEGTASVTKNVVVNNLPTGVTVAGGTPVFNEMIDSVISNASGVAVDVNVEIEYLS